MFNVPKEYQDKKDANGQPIPVPNEIVEEKKKIAMKLFEKTCDDGEYESCYHAASHYIDPSKLFNNQIFFSLSLCLFVFNSVVIFCLFLDCLFSFLFAFFLFISVFLYFFSSHLFYYISSDVFPFIPSFISFVYFFRIILLIPLFLLLLERTDRDPKKAIGLLERACNSSHAPSCYNLAVMYKSGDIGVPKNDAEFEKYKDITNRLIKQFGGLHSKKTA